jgi:predicted nucleotidyltransferase
VFTVEQRDALRERVLRLAEKDERVVAGAVVGSLALGGGDRFSDLDLTFSIADHVPVPDVLDEWTRTLVDELDAVHLVDLERGSTIYRVFLLRDALQFDLSMTPAKEFRPAGPRFRLLFGETVPAEPTPPTTPAVGSIIIPTPAVPEDLFGWGVIYALHARACIERGRVWQAEHYVGAVRDHALSLACLREGSVPVQARGYDDLSTETLAQFEDTHVGALEPSTLRTALAASVHALMREGANARLPHADTVAQRLVELRGRTGGQTSE